VRELGRSAGWAGNPSELHCARFTAVRFTAANFSAEARDRAAREQ